MSKEKQKQLLKQTQKSHSELGLQRRAIEESQRVIWTRFLDYKTSQEKQKQRMATDTKIFGMRATKLRFCTFAK